MNVDSKEINKFAKLASRWWDKDGDFKPLHDINPLRLNYIDDKCNGLANKAVLDVGCGGGILSEAMAQKNAKVKAIDMAEESLEVAKLHLLESKLDVDYQKITIEELAEQEQEKYDIITCLELLEHVPNPASIIKSCQKLVKGNGLVFFSTINRNLKSYLFAIIGAEYILGLLPKGTHEYNKFITPYELDTYASHAGLTLNDIVGMNYNPLSKKYKLSSDASVNYLCYYQRPLHKHE